MSQIILANMTNAEPWVLDSALRSKAAGTIRPSNKDIPTVNKLKAAHRHGGAQREGRGNLKSVLAASVLPQDPHALLELCGPHLPPLFDPPVRDVRDRNPRIPRRHDPTPQGVLRRGCYRCRSFRGVEHDPENLRHRIAAGHQVRAEKVHSKRNTIARKSQAWPKVRNESGFKLNLQEL